MLGAMTVRAAVAVALLAVLAPALSACGTASAPSPPAGVDELVVPTPTPDPADFVDGVDNPWFPLEPGSRQVYDVADAAGDHTLVVTVEQGPTVAGVPTTARVSRELGQRVVDWYAQDDRGNVWWFGSAGTWRAGADGAEAGLVIAGTPRVGDGYRTAYAAGVVEDTAKVLSVSDDVVDVEERSALRPGASSRLTYLRGTGLESEQTVAGAYRVVRLRG
jgi:hypothetical protein